MRELTRVGMQSRTLMEWALRIMANLLQPDEIGAADVSGYAPAFHLRAAMLAYERTLQDACWIAELPITVDGSAGRLLAEVSLREAGWTW